MHTQLALRMVTTSRKLKIGWLVAVSGATLIAMTGLSGSVVAAPRATPAQIQKELIRLNAKAAKLGEKYTAVAQHLVQANQRLRFLKEEAAADRAIFDRMRHKIARLAAIAFEQGGADSPLGLLTSASPQHILNQSSILEELFAADNAQVRQYLNATKDLLVAERATTRAKAGVLRLKRGLGKQLAALKALNKKEGNLLPLLTLEQVASGVHPYLNPLREVSGLVPERVDMGVDFAGVGPVFAIGSGVVMEAKASGSGWPGGGWITYLLTNGPGVGEVVFFAEDVIPDVTPGQKVTPQTVIGHMWSGGDGVETGWAMLDSGSAESQLAEAGGIGGGGPFPTAIGMNFEHLLQAVGVPTAPNAGDAVSGIVPSRYLIDWAKTLR